MREDRTQLFKMLFNAFSTKCSLECDSLLIAKLIFPKLDSIEIFFRSRRPILPRKKMNFALLSCFFSVLICRGQTMPTSDGRAFSSSTGLSSYGFDVYDVSWYDNFRATFSNELFFAIVVRQQSRLTNILGKSLTSNLSQKPGIP